MTGPEKSEKELSLEIRLMRAEDAGGVVELYEAVYGRGYPVKTVYDQAAIIDLQEKGDMIRVIARADGKLVGQVAVFRTSSPNPLVYEEGQGMVLPEYRNKKIIQRILVYAHEAVYPGLKLDQLWGEGVCNHVFMQRNCEQLNYVETGIELDLMPSSSYEKEKSSSGRVATTVVFKTYTPRQKTVYLPEVYRDALEYIYSAYPSGYTFLPAGEGNPDAPTGGEMEIFEGAGVARITVLQAGYDLEEYLKGREAEALSKGCCIMQLYLDLSSPLVGGSVNTARKLGYFLGAALPSWFGGDGLLMQKCVEEPNWAGINLYSDRARRLLEIIRQDRKSVLK